MTTKIIPALDADLERQIQAAINPQYEDMRGTESYERKRLLGEIDRLRTDSERLTWLMEWMALNRLLIYHEGATIDNEYGPSWVLRRPAMVSRDSVEGHDRLTAIGAIDSAMIIASESAANETNEE